MSCKNMLWSLKEHRRSDPVKSVGELMTQKMIKANTVRQTLQQEAVELAVEEPEEAVEEGHMSMICLRKQDQEPLDLNDTNNIVALLKACANEKNLSMGSEIHAQISTKHHLKKNSFIGNTLIHMYMRCGTVSKALRVFDELPDQSVVSWNALIGGYCQLGQGHEAINCFEQMQDEGIPPNSVTYLCILKGCGSAGACKKGVDIHAEIDRQGLLEKNNSLGNALVDMYAKCGALAHAQYVFDQLRLPDVISWTALMVGYVQHGHGKEALICFERMQQEALSPNAMTYAGILKASGCTRRIEKGREIHAKIIGMGLLVDDIVLNNALLAMYSKCGAFVMAKLVFDEIPVCNLASWNALITGYCLHGHQKEALWCFKQMKHKHLSCDAVTFSCILKACGNLGEAQQGEEIHAELVKEGLLGKFDVIGNALVDMYAKCGALERALEVLNNLPAWDVVSWTVLIAGYCQHGHGERALECYEWMGHEGLSPDAVTFSCILKACGSIGALEKGEGFHSEVVREGLQNVSMVGSALVEMFAKCGALAKAQEVFDKLLSQDVLSWTALLAGYGQVGEHTHVFDLFNKMVEEGIQPNLDTYHIVLNACYYSGSVDQGQHYFKMMSTSYGSLPTLEHHTSMVDLLGFAGHLDEAMGIIKKMRSCDYLPVWFALLSACQAWGNVKLGRVAFEHAVRLDEKSPLAYVCMSKLYAASCTHLQHLHT